MNPIYLLNYILLALTVAFVLIVIVKIKTDKHIEHLKLSEKFQTDLTNGCMKEIERLQLIVSNQNEEIKDLVAISKQTDMDLDTIGACCNNPNYCFK